MTSKSRARKFNKKRSNPDDDPYTQRLRKASDAAKAARSRAGGADRILGASIGEVQFDEARVNGQEESSSVRIGEGSRIIAASLVPEGQGTGYILEVGDDAVEYAKADVERTKEALRPQGAPDSASFWQRGASTVPQQPPAEPGSDQEVSSALHWVFFEREVNLIPEYVCKSSCFCDIQADHWKNLGEN